MVKKFVMGLLILTMVISIIGCGEKKETGSEKGEAVVETKPEDLKGELTIWSWDVALEDLRVKSEIFNETSPKVEFIFEEMGTSQVYSKLTTSLASGIGLPDIVSLEGEQMAKFGTKFPDAFVDLTGIVETDKFLPLKMSEVTVNEKVLGYPWDAAPAVLFYRKDLFDKVGIVAEEIITWDDFIEAGKILDQETGIKMMPLAESRNDKMYRILMMQQNSFYFDKDNNTQVNSSESIKAMETVKKIYDAGITINDISWDDNIIAIKDSIIATIPEAIWMVGSIKNAAPDTSGDWRVMKMPGFDKDSLTGSNGGAAVVIPKATKSKEAAIKFLEFAMTDIEGLVRGFKDYGLYPSYIPAYEAPEFSEGLEFFGGQPIYSVANEAAVDMPKVNYTENFSEIIDTMKNAVNQVLTEDQSVETTLNKFESDLVNKFGK